MNVDLSLYLVTDRYDFSDAEFLRIIEMACQGGVTLVQLREKTASTHKFYRLALAVKKITDHYQIPLIINDRLDICLAVDAAGLHIGDDELPPAVCRSLLGPEKILGVSAKTLPQAQAAEAACADYLGVGAMFPTKTKVVTRPTSHQTLKAITAAAGIPVVAIGGITEGRVASFANTGIAGIAVVSEIMLADSVQPKVLALKEAVQQVTGGKVDESK